jgi:hypothetical protein
MPGQNRLDQIRNNYKMWGPRGLLLSHGMFEFGIAFLIKPVRARSLALRTQDMRELHKYGAVELFRRKAKEISTLGMYDSYRQRGWTPRLARQVRVELVPTIVRTVALIWYAATVDAGVAPKRTRP